MIVFQVRKRAIDREKGLLYFLSQKIFWIDSFECLEAENDVQLKVKIL
jgi:hypothetical protein